MLWMLLVFLLLSNMQQHYSCNAFGNPQVPCLFVFGDSLSDNGNNNNLFTLAKTNYPPYGIDFPMGPTGRFTNGRNVIDILAQLLGFDDYIPPFANAKGEEILKGVNYASGGGGIRSETAQELGDQISMDQQLQNHQITVLEMNQMLGNHNKSAAEYLSKCIYVVAIGSNDYVNNYFLPRFFLTSRIYTPQQYAVVLNHQLSQQLTTLYKYGARKFAVYGLGALGSTPYERNSCGSGTNVSACVDNINNAAELFNDGLKSLVAQLNQNLINATFIFINSTGIASSSSSMASMVADVPCCKVSSVTGLCVPFGNPCSNRSQYLFWDALHPTEILYELYARRGYKAESPSDAYPFDITHLALL
ncbi:GDSL esterase/lipase At1g29670-like [Corylus avellana]|uniref:GDSL esterase/lipase At1g29670-like n=1 Tax=Corylus avellana TaxID=13451 RepID=UPI00286C0512|nr:GDSL esterase/lipase At1g29670-like [Corylus avellana]